LKEEFTSMLSVWEIDEDASGKAYDYITDGGKKKMNYPLFVQFMREFFTNEEKGHPINMGLDAEIEGRVY
jgi:hypothetical protein